MTQEGEEVQRLPGDTHWAAIPGKAFLSSIQQLHLRRDTATGSKTFLFLCEKGLRIFVVHPLCHVSEILMIIPLINN